MITAENLADGSMRFNASSVESGELSWSLDVPASERTLSVEETAVLSARGSESTGWDVLLHRPGRQAVVIPGVRLTGGLFGSVLRVEAADSRTFLVRDRYRIWAVDVASAEAVVLGTEVGLYDKVLMTPSRVFWVAPYYPIEQPANLLTWWGRDGSAGGSVVVAPEDGHTQEYIAFGDRVAALHSSPLNPKVYRYELRPINLETGSRETAVAVPVATAASMEDGRVALILADTANGQVAVVGDDGAVPRTVTELPVVGVPVESIWLSQGTVTGHFLAPSNHTPLVRTTAVGTDATWTTGYPGILPQEGKVLAVSGGTMLTSVGSPNWYTREIRVSWPGGQRDVAAYQGRLGRGGALLAHFDIVPGWKVEFVRGGAALTRVDMGEPFAMDGATLWRGPDAAGRLIGTTFLEDGTATDHRTVQTQLGCGTETEATLQVAGRWALVNCSMGAWAIDLLGVAAPWRIEGVPEGTSHFAMGEGHVAWIQSVDGGSPEPVIKAVVADLAPSHGTRSYGPLLSNAHVMMVLDDLGTPRIAWIASESRLRVAELDWLDTPPPVTPDPPPTVEPEPEPEPAPAPVARAVLPIRAADTSLTVRSLVADRWQPSVTMGGKLSEDPGATMLTDGRALVAVKGSPDGLYLRHTGPGGLEPAHGFTHLGGQLRSRPSLTALPDGQALAVVCGSDGLVWQTTIRADRTRSGWLNLGGDCRGGGPAITRTSEGRVLVSALAQDRSVRIRTGTAGTLGPWKSLGGTATGAVATTALSGSSVWIVVRGSDGKAWGRDVDLATGALTGWANLGGALAGGSSPVAVTTTSDQRVIVLGTNGASYECVRNAGGYTTWARI